MKTRFTKTKTHRTHSVSFFGCKSHSLPIWVVACGFGLGGDIGTQVCFAQRYDFSSSGEYRMDPAPGMFPREVAGTALYPVQLYTPFNNPPTPQLVTQGSVSIFNSGTASISFSRNVAASWNESLSQSTTLGGFPTPTVYNDNLSIDFRIPSQVVTFQSLPVAPSLISGSLYNAAFDLQPVTISVGYSYTVTENGSAVGSGTGVEDITFRMEYGSFDTAIGVGAYPGKISLGFTVVEPKFPAQLTSIVGRGSGSILFVPVGRGYDLKREDFKRVKPYQERFGVQIGPLKALDF